MNPYGNSGDGWEGYDSMQAAPTKTTATYQADGLAERVIVPGLTAAIVGAAAGLLAGLVIGAFGLKINPWWTMPIVALSVFLAIFWGTSRRGQWLIERISGADLNGDGYVGQPIQQAIPALPPQRMTIDLIQNDGRRGDTLNLPCGPEKLKALASGLTQGRQFAQSVWCGNGAIFTRAEFEATRAALIEGGLLAWNKPGFPAQGVSITPAGRAVFRRLAAHPSPTSEG